MVLYLMMTLSQLPKIEPGYREIMMSLFDLSSREVFSNSRPEHIVSSINEFATKRHP